MGRNWIRDWSLTVEGDNGSKTFVDLRIVFSIKQWHSQSPNMASFRVYNVSPDTRARFQNKEFSTVTFSAGYKDNSGVLFKGNIIQSIFGHETAVDTYLDIFCADGQNGYQQARVGKTLAAGWTPKDKAQVALDALAPFGITLGTNTLDLSQPKYPRGRPFIGMARDLLRQVTLSAGGLWSIQNGVVKITPKSLDTGSSSAVKLTAATGLIGWPQQTDDGIRIRSLINPQLQPLMKVTLDPSQIIEAEKNNNPYAGKEGATKNDLLDAQGLGAGTYTIFAIDRFGDSRGQDWYDESLCVGQSSSVPVSQGKMARDVTLGSL